MPPSPPFAAPSRRLRLRLPRSLRGRLLVLGGLAFLLATAFSVVLVGVEYRAQAALARAEVLERAEGVASQMQEVLRGAREVANRLALHPSVLAGDADACALWIREAAGLLPQLADLQAFTPEGIPLCSARGLVVANLSQPAAMRGAPGGAIGGNPDPPPPAGNAPSPTLDPMAPNPVALDAFALDPFASDPVVRDLREVGAPVQVSASGAGGEWVVPVAGRAGADGIRTRVLLRTGPLSNLLASVAQGDGDVLTLADSSGIAVARSANPSLWVGRNLLTTGVVEPPAGRAGTFESPGADGERRTWGYVRIDDTPWILLVGSPLAAVLNPVQAAALRHGLSLVLVTGLFGLLLLGAERTLREALTRLGDGATEAQGRLGVRLPERGPAEVVSLARTLNRTLKARDEAERGLAELVERHELVLRASRDMIWDWDLVGRELRMNESFRRFLGAGADRATDPEAWFSRIPKGERERVAASLEQTLSGGGSLWIQEYPVEGPDGALVRMLDRAYVVRTGGGAAVRMVGVMSDVTEARQRTDEVRRTKERYESILRNAPFGVFLCTEDGILVEWNPALETLLGEAWQARGPRRQVPDFFTRPEHFDRFARDAREQGQVIGREALWTRADGSEIYVRLTLSTFREEGELRIEALAEDVTDRRRLGEQVRHAQKMEAVGRLAGGVAHDFNNLLTVISGESRILLTEVALDPEGRESVEAILEAGERGTALTRQLLAFSRRPVVELAPVSLNEVVERVDRMLSRLLGEHVVLRTHLAEALPPVVADAGELEQVILNLAVNARDAMPGGGEIELRTWRRTLTPSELDRHPGLEAGPYVMLSVADQGTGIDHAILSRIFEPFFTTKAVGKGTGLGLSMVYGIVSRLGGKVEVESEPGQGTTFHLFFPVGTGGAPVARPLRPSSPRALGGDGRIAVVEDEDGVRRMALRILERAGYDVSTHARGEEALEALLALPIPPNLLLTDVRMPGMHGNELADRLRERWPDLPVLFMSGYPEEAAIAERIQRRDSDFLAKPFSPETLLNAVRLLLNVNSAARAGSPTQRDDRS